MEQIVLESCHSTWVFDTEPKRFCRILKGIEAVDRTVATEWRSYSYLDVDQTSESFTVYLNEERTRRIHSWRHLQDCVQCGGHATVELSSEDIRNALNH